MACMPRAHGRAGAAMSARDAERVEGEAEGREASMGYATVGGRILLNIPSKYIG